MQDQRITRECAHCKASFLIKRSRAANGRGRFCSMACKRAAGYAGKSCEADGCDRTPRTRRLCGLHYQRLLAQRSMAEPVRLRGVPPLIRFMTYVNCDGPIPDARPDLGPCWIWMGGEQGKSGYGSFSLNSQPTLAHRAAYELLVGPIPEEMTLDHLCRNRRCVRAPEHLEPVPFVVNVARGMSPTAINARKTHCPQGHPYDDANTMRRKRGGRDCRACRQRRWTP